MSDLDTYEETLTGIRDYLVQFDDKLWAPVLTEWLADLHRGVPLEEHVRRTLKATGGMGSLGDLSIAPINGHTIPDDPRRIGEASEHLWHLISQLYKEAQALLDHSDK